MEEKTYTEEELVQKHKKERKELQAQIQSLKKSICKGDKKKKREVSEEIAHMESDLDKQQEEELTRLKLMQVNISNEKDSKEDTNEITNFEAEDDQGSGNPSSVPVSRISKAQKRREKKANAEKERNQRIIEQEALNVFGKRNVEIQTINEILCQRGLMIHEIPSDGHCLYNAVAHQLKTVGEIPPSLHDLRNKTAVYLRENMNDCLPFMSNSESDTMLSPEQYEKYCHDVAHTSAWGGAVELRVLSRVLQCPIEVIHASGNPYVFGDEYNKNKKLIVTYHRHMYELGAHYNSVMQYVKIINES